MIWPPLLDVKKGLCLLPALDYHLASPNQQLQTYGLYSINVKGGSSASLPS